MEAPQEKPKKSHYRPASERPPHKITCKDILELPREWCWIATRFALKERKYTDPPPRRIVQRFKLEQLSEADIGRLVEFCKESKASVRFITASAARIRPHPNKAENDRLMYESHGILFEI